MIGQLKLFPRNSLRIIELFYIKLPMNNHLPHHTVSPQASPPSSTESSITDRRRGDLDDFTLWNRGMSIDELREIYNAGRQNHDLGTLLK